MVQTQYFQTFQFFVLQRCESDEFGSVHFMWIFFADHFDVLAPAGADA
jgi:hypothetical protein